LKPATLRQHFVACLIAVLILFSADGVQAKNPTSPSTGSAHQIATNAYVAYAAGDFTTASNLAEQAVQLRPTDGRYLLLLVDAALNDGQPEKARAALRQYAALPKSASSPSPLDMAYRAIRAKDDSLALQYFAQSDQQGTSTPAASLDAAYAARRLYRDDETLVWLGRFERQEPQVGGVTAQQRQNAKALATQLTRRWRGQAYLYSGPAGWAIGAVPPPGQRKMVQASVELAYSPKVHLHPADGGIELFARYFMTLDDANGGATGAETGQPSLGIRWRPVRDADLVLEYSRLIKAGVATRGDNLFRVAYSTGTTPTAPTMWRLYAEANHFTESGQTTGVVDLSHSWALGSQTTSSPLLLMLSLVYTHDSMSAEPGAASLAAGFTKSFAPGQRRGAALDLTVQYRVPLAGDIDRARGLALIASTRF
jgi:hypothetical protein